MNLLKDIKEWADNSIIDEILLLALLIAIIESIAQNTIKTSEHGSIKFILGLSIYIIVGYILHYAYHHHPISKLNVTWSSISIIFGITLGYFLYDEEINKYTFLSIALALGAIISSSKI